MQGRERFVRWHLFGLYQMALSIQAENFDLGPDEGEPLDTETLEGNPKQLQNKKSINLEEQF